MVFNLSRHDVVWKDCGLKWLCYPSQCGGQQREHVLPGHLCPYPEIKDEWHVKVTKGQLDSIYTLDWTCTIYDNIIFYLACVHVLSRWIQTIYRSRGQLKITDSKWLLVITLMHQLLCNSHKCYVLLSSFRTIIFTHGSLILWSAE